MCAAYNLLPFDKEKIIERLVSQPSNRSLEGYLCNRKLICSLWIKSMMKVMRIK